MLNDSGGIIDDLVVWWWEPERYWVFPNAANHARVMAAFAAKPGCWATDLRSETVLIAVQGPEAPTVLESLVGVAPKRFRTAVATLEGQEVLLAGTGYTGERGGEVCAGPDAGRSLVEALVAAGATPCGLAARDTLRLEAGLPLWGADIDEDTTPYEAGLHFAVDLGHEFRGKRALEAEAVTGVARRLVGFILDEKGIPRHGYRVRTSQAHGEVTSGNISPMLDKGIGLAYVSPPSSEAEIEVEIRHRWVPGRIVRPPFHKEQT
jgi:aminomethyltransferase